MVSGRLWRNSLVTQDEETGTYWSHVSGELAGQRLEEIPVTLAFWFAWSSFYPNTDVL